jgi:hypothetical protein
MRIDEHLQTLVHRMVELETARLLPGQRVVVDSAEDGQLTLSVDGVDVRVDRAVAAEVYVSV